MSPKFKTGISINNHRSKAPVKHLRVRAGKQRDRYVHDIVFEAKILGRREAWERLNPGQPCPEDDFYAYLERHETVDHHDQDSLNNSPENLVRMTRGANTGKANRNRKKKKSKPKPNPNPDVPF